MKQQPIPDITSRVRVTRDPTSRQWQVSIVFRRCRPDGCEERPIRFRDTFPLRQQAERFGEAVAHDLISRHGDSLFATHRS